MLTVLAEPDTLRALGEFLINASADMAANGLEHVHLQDAIEHFSHQEHVDVIALNRAVIKPA
ncbi:Imm32 family immunity protein [Pseudomonas protegens]|uniref:Imm32 family immunity protein n=1 Tax=Pseudomonas protegens TaxID=380021 RepID=UPI003D162759